MQEICAVFCASKTSSLIIRCAQQIILHYMIIIKSCTSQANTHTHKVIGIGYSNYIHAMPPLSWIFKMYTYVIWHVMPYGPSPPYRSSLILAFSLSSSSPPLTYVQFIRILSVRLRVCFGSQLFYHHDYCYC